MKANNNIKYISLKKASNISGYSSDYLGFLIRNGELNGKKIYKNVSWQISLFSINKYFKKHHSSNNKNWKSLFIIKDKYISLKKASRILGYSSDYLGSLIREGKVKGKKVYLNSSWVTTKKALLNYKKNKKQKRKILYFKKQRFFLKRVEDDLFILKNRTKRKLIYCNNLYNNRKAFADALRETFRVSLVSIVVFSLILSLSPIVFLRNSIGTIFAEQEKIINFYPSVATGDWQNLENVQGIPEVESLGGINLFSKTNSAIYTNGPLSLIVESFQSDFSSDELIQKQIEFAKIKFSFAIGGKETDILIDQQNTNEEQEINNEEIGFWDKTKNFFKFSVAKTINSAKSSLVNILSIAEAEEVQNIDDQQQIIDQAETTEEIEETNLENTEQEPEEPAKPEQVLITEIVQLEQEIEEQKEPVEPEQDTNLEEPINPQENEETETTEETTEQESEEPEDTEENEEPEGEVKGAQTENTETTSTEEFDSNNEATSTEENIDNNSSENFLPNIDTKIIIWYSLDDQNWQELDTIYDYPLSNALNNGYFEYDASFLKNWNNIENLKIKFEGAIGGETNIFTYLDSAWVEVNYQEEENNNQSQETNNQSQTTNESGSGTVAGVQDTNNETEETIDTQQESNTEKNSEEETELENENQQIEEIEEPEEVEEEEEIDLEQELLNDEDEEEENEEEDEKEEGIKGEIELKSKKKDFQLNEKPEFRFKYKYEKNSNILPLWKNINIEAQIRDPGGGMNDISSNIIFEDNGEFSFKLDKPRAFNPGLQRLIFIIEEDGQIQKFEQTFTWGVLAINFDKSIYSLNEKSYLQMAVLDNRGHTICDAPLKLQITDPNFHTKVLSTQNGTIQYSGKCGSDNVIDVPDYFAYYQTNKAGTYHIKLINLDNGYEIKDSFEVRDYIPFDIERIGPTRIYPLANYEMIMKIKTDQDFTGQIMETLPVDFEILTTYPLSKNNPLDIQNNTKDIIWNVDWKAGNEYELKYEFDAPDISPYFYLLGPLKFFPGSPLVKDQGNIINYFNNSNDDNLIFQETRSWQIASDAPQTISLYVNSVDYPGWDTQGASPYLSAQDQPTNYIYESGRNTNSGNFGFTDSSDLGEINSVYLYIYAYKGSGDFTTYLNTTDTGLGPPADWGWVNVNVSSILTTWSAINSATVMFDRPNTKYETRVDAAYLYVTYTPPNDAPNIPINPSPANASTSVALSPILSVDVYDINGDAMTVSFYNGTSSEFIASTSIAASGSTSTATTTWSSLSEHTVYQWYAVADDGDLFATSSTWSFTTINDAPNIPDNPSPANSSTSVALSPVLSVDVYDQNNEDLTVSFYNASTSALIGTTSVAASGSTSTATTTWSSLSGLTEYQWFAVVDDGDLNATSSTWSFTTRAAPIDISGDVYTDEGSTKTTDTSTIALAINGNKTATTSISSGAYSFSDTGVTTTDVVTIFWDTDGGNKAVTITRDAYTTISGFDLYQNRVIIRQEDSNPITISNMNNFDSGQDSDVLYTSDGTDLTVNAEAELYIWPNKEFAPGGNVTLSAGGSGDAWDGSLKICSGATFTAVGTESHSIGGNWVASFTANFTPANSIITFTSTASGKTIITAGNPFYSLTFNGSGGAWTFQDIATTTNNLTISNGTVSSAYNMNVLGGGVTGNGTLNWTAGTFLIDGTGNFGGTSNWTFYNLTFGDGSGAATTTGASTGTTTISNVLTIASNQTLNAGSRIWTLTGSGTPFVINGTFGYQTSTFRYTANDDTYITATDYYNLELSPENSAPDAPDTPSPANASTSVATSSILSVDVYDTDGDSMTISFYNASTSALIGTTSVAASPNTSTATTTWSGLDADTTYQWFAVADDGSLNATSTTWSFITIEIEAWECGDVLSYEGKNYDTVEIGDQCWMAENLDYDNGCSSNGWVDETDTGWCGYYDGAGSDDTYGMLYQWSAAMNGTTTDGAQGICPTGWHLPTHDELTTLERQICSDIENSSCDTTFPYDTSTTGYLGDGEGSAMAASSTLWTDNDLESDPDFGASGLDLFPTGARIYTNGSYANRSNYAYLWSSTQFGSSAWRRVISYASTKVDRNSYDFSFGLSVRCIKD